MFQIGEFARLLGLSVRALRHYEELGLLKSQRSPGSGYRCYTTEHLRRMQRVLALRDMGFSLERIKLVLDGLPPGQFTNLLRATYEDLRGEHQRLGEKLRKLEEQLKELPMYAAEIRSIPAQRVVCAKGNAQDYKHVTKPMTELGGLMHSHLKMHGAKPAGPDIVIWSADYGEMDEFALEFMSPVASDIPGGERVRVQTLDAVPMMGVVRHEGSYEQLSEGYAFLADWIDRNGYERTGALREVYLHYGCDDPTKNVTEIHVPVKKAAAA